MIDLGLNPPQLATQIKRLELADRLIRRNPLLYSRIASELETFAGATDAEQRRWRAEKLARVVRAARRTAYGRKIQGPARFEDWPVLEKYTVRDDPGDFIARPLWLTVGASTSGTSGIPLQLRRSLSSVACEQVMLDRLLERHGASALRCKGAVLRGDDVKDPADRKPPFWRIANGGLRLIFSSNHLDLDTVEHFVAALREYAPDVIFAYPTVLESLCSLMLQRGLHVRVPLTVCGSEVLTPATMEIARSALRTRIAGYYGQAERVGWAEGDPEHGYRFAPAYSVNELRFVESTDDADIYELIGTGLWNNAMPFVRYRTGDQFRLRKGSDPQAVAEGRESFLSIIGRSGDFLISPSGAKLMGIDHIPRGVPRVVRTQFIQDSPESVTMLVVPAPGFDDECIQLLRQHAALKLPPSMTLRIETTTKLVRGQTGKAPLVVRRNWSH